MNKVYLYGMISASTVHLIDDEFVYPHPNEYAEIKETLFSIGGEAANSAIILSKLGVKTKLDGVWLKEKSSQKTLTKLCEFGIDTSRLISGLNFGAEEVVITDKNSRTVFGNYAAFFRDGNKWNSPIEADIQDVDLVCLDPYFKDDSVLAAEMCVRNNIPYVSSDCEFDNYISQNAASIILSHELRDKAYPSQNMIDVFEKYQQYCKGLIISTYGSDELWYGRKNEPMKKYKPFEIVPVDTAGAGDSFRSGIVYGLLQKWNDEKIIEFACAVAACVCLTYPHTLGAPGLNAVIEFLSKNNRTKFFE